jgi:hypothetical protein
MISMLQTMPETLSPPDFAAPATLHRQSKLLQGHEGTFAALVGLVMRKRDADRVLYSIMVGEKVYNVAEIEEIHKRPDFPA